MFVLFKFRDYTKLNLVGGERNSMERDAPRLPTAFSRLRCIKRPVAFSFKLSYVLKTAAAFSSEINPDHGGLKSQNTAEFLQYYHLLTKLVKVI